MRYSMYGDEKNPEALQTQPKGERVTRERRERTKDRGDCVTWTGRASPS